MKKRLASLVLLLIMAGSTLAGIPLHFGESECGMDAAMGMDCCKAALRLEQTPDISTAKLCCALNCAQNVTNSPQSNSQVTPPSPVRTPVAFVPPATTFVRKRAAFLHGPPGPTPTYLRNLALLI